MAQGYKIDEALAQQYRIDTGWIFSYIHEHYKDFEREFLKNDFQNALVSILNSRKIYSNIFTESNSHYLERKFQIYVQELENDRNGDFFPFLDYYMRLKNPDDAFPSIVSFEESCVIENGEYYFDFLFALKITTFDLMKIDEFFKFHLNTSFKRNKKRYFDFLNKLTFKYDNLLARRFANSIKNYQDKFPNQVSKKEAKQIKIEGQPKESNLRWLVENETEFVQFVYGLHKAGYLTNTGDTITKIVPQVAEAFNLKLGKNWQSNLSESVHGRNNDYNPEIFGKIAEGYNRYKDEQAKKNHQKKNSPK